MGEPDGIQVREATEKERQVFKDWFVGRDDLTWTRLHMRAFVLRVTTGRINCTVMQTAPDEYLLGEADIIAWAADVERDRRDR